MATKPTHPISFDVGALTDQQANGIACVTCGVDFAATGLPSVPVGSLNGVQLFACASHVEPAAAGKSADWPGGEPASVRDAQTLAALDGLRWHMHLQQDAPKRPSWLPGGCPSWCDWGPLHRESDMYDDRWHSGGVREVEMTAADPIEGALERDNEPTAVRAYLVQHYRERAPRIELDRDGLLTGIVLTVDEAEEFARKLLELVDVAHGHAAR